MVIASLGAGLLQLQSAIDNKMNFAVDRRRALYLAEAGIAEAALAVTSGRTGIIGSEAVPAAFGGGVFWVESDDLPDDRIVLRCTAQVGTAEIALRSMVLPSVNPVTSLGIFGIEGVRIGWGTVVDGYHSGRGDYASQLDAAAPILSTGEGGLIGSDSDITLEDNLSVPFDRTLPPTYIFGDLRPGSGHHVVSSGLPQMFGAREPYEAPPHLPEITLPDPDEIIRGTLTIEADQDGIGVAMATHVMGEVLVDFDVKLKITGPAVLRCTSITLERGATLILDDTEGPIHIYAEEGLHFGDGSFIQSIAPEETARGTFLLIPGKAAASNRVDFGCEGAFRGALYAPDDVVSLNSGLRWMGSLVARLVMTDPGTHITVDRRLTLSSDGFPSLPRQLSWQLVALGDEIARPLAMEPRLALAMRGVTPLPSSTAALETDLELQYMNIYSQAATYRGALAAFDPKNAERIIGAKWVDPRDGSMRAWTAPPGSESTNAVEGLRSDLRELRTLIQTKAPNLDAATLTDDQAVEAAAAAVAPADVAAQTEAVKRAVQRTDETVAAITLDLPTAIRAANAARGFANDAQALLDLTVPLAGGALSPAAEAALKALTNATERAEARAVDSEANATNASTAAGERLEYEADNAIKRALEAKDEFDAAQIEYDLFMAAL